MIHVSGAHDLLGAWAAVQSPLYALGRGHSRLSLNPRSREKVKDPSRQRNGEAGQPIGDSQTEGGQLINPGGGLQTEGPQLPSSSRGRWPPSSRHQEPEEQENNNNPGEAAGEGEDGNEPGQVTRPRTVPVPTESGREPTVRPPTEPAGEHGEPTAPHREPSQPPPTEPPETEGPFYPHVTERPILIPGTELPRTQHPNIGVETEEPPLIRPSEPAPTESHEARTTTHLQQVQTTSATRPTTHQPTSRVPTEPPTTSYIAVESSDRTPTVRPITEPSYQSPTAQVAPSSSRTTAPVPTLSHVSVVPTVKPEKPTEKLTSRPPLPTGSMSIGVTAAVTIAVIFCISLVLFIAIQVIRKQQNLAFKRQYYGNKSTPGLDTTDSFPLEYCSPEKSSTLSSEPSKSELAFVNEALERDGPCNLLSLSGIVKFYSNIRTIVEEFESLPMPMPKSSDIPPGTEDRNRYMNVLPVSQTRVPLLKRPGFPHSDYINANFVTGYKFQTRAYIATQAPLDQTCEDFWRMVWEQQAPAIIMLTDFEEQEVVGEEKKPKCAQYFPLEEGLHNTLVFGDYSVTTKKSCRRKGYRITTLQLKDLEFNLCREVTHYWMTSWPVFGVPRTTAHILHLLQDVRLTVRAREVLHSKPGPVVVHCSPGTGRTGVVMAIDIGMRWMDDTGAADVLNTVHNMRHERAGAIMTKQQYAFTYKALSRYAKKLMKLEQGCESSESESDEELDWVEGTA
ncbi:PREDICTED: receptor-type tyrosine-protein phosphatase gamma-like [Branchiostoma belcheri]|uniref:protein-tyrosine-phosphatase n=1 Tax=Branchiostoma belcheri TaxID=7741 RepID=A0A6P4Y6W3_BRABE|nr:PREDICTED: receptor-type tyrosine-protein phosphatase gamma-like [Branchiostoma belcheri]